MASLNNQLFKYFPNLCDVYVQNKYLITCIYVYLIMTYDNANEVSKCFVI